MVFKSHPQIDTLSFTQTHTDISNREKQRDKQWGASPAGASQQVQVEVVSDRDTNSETNIETNNGPRAPQGRANRFK